MSEEDSKRKTSIEFRTKESSEPGVTMSIAGSASDIHKSPEKLRAIMEMLDLPEGTIATVTVLVSSTIVR
jgi:hypothetical protein